VAANVGSTGVIIENNLAHDLGPAQIGNIYAEGTFDWTFRNNIFANVGAGIRAYVSGLKFYNNIFYNCSNVWASENQAILFGGYNSTGGAVINNSFIGCGYDDDTNVGFHNGPGSYNFVSTRTGGAKASFSEPGLVNGGTLGLVAPYTNCLTNTCNFQLNSSSAMINKGTTIATFSTDYLGVSRPVGAAWDIGPYEYSPDGDFTPPILDNLFPSGSLACSANPRNVTLSLTTNETATCRMAETDIAYASMTDTFTNTAATAHSEVKSLACGQSKTYYVRCIDAAGNPNTSSSTISFSIASPQIAGPGGLRIVGGKLH